MGRDSGEAKSIIWTAAVSRLGMGVAIGVFASVWMVHMMVVMKEDIVKDLGKL